MVYVLIGGAGAVNLAIFKRNTLSLHLHSLIVLLKQQPLLPFFKFLQLLFLLLHLIFQLLVTLVALN
jgi:hypothetical protein